MGRPKKSTASSATATKGIKASKNTAALKKAAAATVAPAAKGLAFKATKITRWSEKKKEKEVDGEVVKVEVEKTKEVEEVVEVVESKTEKEPVTPRKTRGKRTIEDMLEVSSVVKRARIKETIVEEETEEVKPVTPSKQKTLAAAPVPSSDAVEPASETNPDNEEEVEEDLALPKQVVRLIKIHGSIISLLLLHYATNSQSQPALLSEYLTQISRNANTNVSLTDLQRICTLSQKSLRLVKVDNRGNAIELTNGVSSKISNLSPEFKEYIQKWWDEKPTSLKKDVEKLLGDIELSPIFPQTSFLTPPVTPSKPKLPSTPLSKGQRRLQDLKAFTLSKRTSVSPSPVKKENIALLPSSRPPSVANKNSSLLERIRAKAQAASEAAPAPAPEVLQRRHALQWLEDIIPVLLQLTTPASSLDQKDSKSKLHVPSTTSFPMATVVQNVKTSLQKPISTDEVERSLRVLADEVASEFVKIVEWKGGSTGNPLVGVVFNRKGRGKVEGWKYVEEA